MSRVQQRRADAERNITAIIDAAVEAFAKDANASMSEIARAAGVGRVTLYAHFPSRQELLTAVLDRVLEHSHRVLEADGQGAGALPADEALADLVRSSWRLLDRYRRIRTAALAELGAQQLRARHNAFTTRIEALVRRGRREGVLRSDLPIAWATSTVYALVHGAADEVDAGAVAAEKVPGLLAATVLGALRPPS